MYAYSDNQQMCNTAPLQQPIICSMIHFCNRLYGPNAPRKDKRPSLADQFPKRTHIQFFTSQTCWARYKAFYFLTQYSMCIKPMSSIISIVHWNEERPFLADQNPQNYPLKAFHYSTILSQRLLFLNHNFLDCLTTLKKSWLTFIAACSNINWYNLSCTTSIHRMIDPLHFSNPSHVHFEKYSHVQSQHVQIFITIYSFL